MRFLFACGASAGHINPALAVAGRLRELLPESEFLFAGTKDGIEMELVPREGYEIRTVDITSIHRSFAPKDIVHNLKTVRNISLSRAQARKIIEEFRPDAVIGTGGYVCYPVLKAAAKMGVPTLIHESNAVPGLTSRALENSVDVIMVGFEGCVKAYKKQEKVIVTGTPVRGDFARYSREKAREELGIEESEKLLVSFWGSLGASNMNAVTEDLIAENEKSPAFRHIHASGSGEEYARRMRENALKKAGKEGFSQTDLRAYIYDMPRVMAAADVIMCRAGASTLAELTATGHAAVLVPSPYVTNNHQEKNAVLMRDAGGAVMVREPEATGKGLFETLKGLFSDDNRLSNMCEAMKKAGSANAADTIAGEVLRLAQDNKR